MNVVKTRRRVTYSKATPMFLKRLGIKFRGTTRNFWENNASILGDLCNQMQTRVRELFHEHHPDKGGEAADFDNLLTSYKRAKRSFAIHGVTGGKEFTPGKAVCGVDQRVGKNKPEKINAAAKMLLQGETATRTARTIKLSRTTVNRLRRSLQLQGFVIKGCGCGRAAGHRGWCRYRIDNFAPDRSFTNFIEGGKPTRLSKTRHFNRGRAKKLKQAA